jgi:tRNA-specific 2-thiouridylase
MGSGKSVEVAMSGGIDSTAAVMLLKEQGYRCSGVYMLTCENSRHTQPHAEKAADKLGIKLDIVDFRKDFEQVINYFCSEYQKGRTPNPCVYCNRYIKFGKLFDYAESSGADFFATGHYVKIIKSENGVGLYESSNREKDQSYALAMVNRNVLERLITPLGDYTKNYARELVSKLGIGLEKKPESQEICFIPDDDYISFIEQHLPQLVREGNIIDSEGNILGKHNGTHRYTIGQRRGLGVAMGVPYYVCEINSSKNSVTLGDKKQVMHKSFTASSINWLAGQIKEPFRGKVKIRYNAKSKPALITPCESGLEIEFDKEVHAVTPGQLAVIYKDFPEGDKVICGGWIDD